ncbi:MAG: carboxypeptidase-like regulatory domain-containing protein [Pirellulaceae bacterium]|nr:carboxypeptidase-like regulatory domain-containing protein [Pirellulaceae bacterium]
MINKLTGEPILGMVHGVAETNMPNVVEYLPQGSSQHPRARTEIDGSFQLAALPGKFRLGFMADQFHSFELAPLFPIGESVSQPLSGLRMNYSTEFNLEQADENIPDIELSPATIVEIQLQDASGNPIKEVAYSGSQGTFAGVLPSSRLVVLLNPRENQHEYFIYHLASGDAAKITLTPTVDSPVVVRMAPAATARGRLVDESGKPIAGATVFGNGIMRRVTSEEVSKLGYVDPMPQSDDDGRFELVGLVPGEIYKFRVSERKAMMPDELTIEVSSTDVIDLGEVACLTGLVLPTAPNLVPR